MKQEKGHTNRYSNELNKQVKIALNNNEEYKTFHYLFSKYMMSLNLARNKNIKLANLIFYEGEIVFNSLSSNQDFQKIINIIRLPLLSYLNYKFQFYNDAINNLKTTIIESEYLSNKYSFEVLYFHRIQQFQNIARVYFSQKKIKNWKILMRNILLYQFELEDKIICEDLRVEKSIIPQINNHQDVMIDQILRETIKFCEIINCKLTLTFIINDILNIKNNQSPFKKDIILWVNLKSASFKGDFQLLEKIGEVKNILKSENIGALYKENLLKDLKKLDIENINKLIKWRV